MLVMFVALALCKKVCLNEIEHARVETVCLHFVNITAHLSPCSNLLCGVPLAFVQFLLACTPAVACELIQSRIRLLKRGLKYS